MNHGTDKRTKQLIIIAVCLLIFVIGIAKDMNFWMNEDHQSIFKIFNLF